jgi:2-amino-4-hydroxy-6-hydroxymethyldihydropteridine diphosphokinase
VEQDRFELIETLALCVVNRILDNYPVDGVCVRVRKPEVLLPGPLSWAGVEVCRRKQLSPENPAAVYVALGSNLGDREAYLWQALGLLAAEPAVKVQRVSSFYETKPVGNPQQPDFLNAVVQLACALSPLELLRTLQAIEKRLGRVRREPWGPRTIDLDLLLFGQVTVEEPGLTVPHPRLLERDFVLVPLAEIAPDLTLPDGRCLPEIISQLTNLPTNLLSKRPSRATIMAQSL